jgi:hypothetical protein
MGDWRSPVLPFLVFAVGCNSVFGIRSTTLVDAPGPDAAFDKTNVVFVTSTVQRPVFSNGLADADRICAERAQAAHLAGSDMPGAYVAYLALNGATGADRLVGARGWSRPDGRPVADLPSDLVAGNLYNPPRLDETGADVESGDVVATGEGSQHCSYYTDPMGSVSIGRPYDTSATWHLAAAISCMSPMHLYCFGVSLDVPLVVTPAAGRRAFVTLSSFTPTGGIAAADALCDQDGAASPGTYHALLATSTAGAIAPGRFSLTGANWVRPDGIPVAASPQAFAEGRWVTSLGVYADGAHVGGNTVTFTGVPDPAASLTAPGSNSCSDWTASGGSGATVGLADASDKTAVDNFTSVCTPAQLYCLEP